MDASQNHDNEILILFDQNIRNAFLKRVYWSL